MEFNSGVEMEGLFAGTPPLEAVKVMVSEAATVEEKTIGGKTMVIADVSRAFFETVAIRSVCVELVAEDRTEEDEKADNVGWLQLSMYGARDAARNWQEEVARWAKGIGFRR